MPIHTIHIAKRSIESYFALGLLGIVVAWGMLTALAVFGFASALFVQWLFIGGLITTYSFNVFLEFTRWKGQHSLYHYFLLLTLSSICLAYFFEEPIVQTLDIYLIGFSIIAGFGRFGCYQAGCCHGKHWKYGIRYDKSYSQFLSQDLIHNALFPTQLIESIFHISNAALGIVLLTSTAEAGIIALSLSGLYAIFRFLIEFVRGDFRRHFLHLSEAQWTALVILVFNCTLAACQNNFTATRSEAIKAYNGDESRANYYRDNIVTRRDKANLRLGIDPTQIPRIAKNT